MFIDSQLRGDLGGSHVDCLVGVNVDEQGSQDCFFLQFRRLEKCGSLCNSDVIVGNGGGEVGVPT